MVENTRRMPSRGVPAQGQGMGVRGVESGVAARGDDVRGHRRLPLW